MGVMKTVSNLSLLDLLFRTDAIEIASEHQERYGDSAGMTRRKNGILERASSDSLCDLAQYKALQLSTYETMISRLTIGNT